MRELLLGRASVLHTHWKPTSRIRGRSALKVAARAAGLLLIFQIARLRGIRVIWTAHNLETHDSSVAHPALERCYWSTLPKLLDAVISLTASAVPLLHERYPGLRDVPTWIIPHGNYRNVYPQHATRDAARARFGIAPGARVFTFVGQIRPYKNVIALIRAFRELEDEHAILLIGGMVKLKEERAEFDALIAADSRIHVVPRFVPDDELQYFLAAADLIVLPFASVLNSGSAILALSFDRPVLVPALGALTDLAAQIGNGWVITYENELNAAVLNDGMRKAQLRRDERAPIDSLDWNHIAEKTCAVYEAAIAQTPNSSR